MQRPQKERGADNQDGPIEKMETIEKFLDITDQKTSEEVREETVVNNIFIHNIMLDIIN